MAGVHGNDSLCHKVTSYGLLNDSRCMELRELLLTQVLRRLQQLTNATRLVSWGRNTTCESHASYSTIIAAWWSKCDSDLINAAVCSAAACSALACSATVCSESYSVQRVLQCVVLQRTANAVCGAALCTECGPSNIIT